MTGRRITAAIAARALLGACRRFGENAELVAQGACPNSRAAFHAWAGLRRAFPERRFDGPLNQIASDWALGFANFLAAGVDVDTFKCWAGAPVLQELIARLARQAREAD